MRASSCRGDIFEAFSEEVSRIPVKGSAMSFPLSRGPVRCDAPGRPWTIAAADCSPSRAGPDSAMMTRWDRKVSSPP